MNPDDRITQHFARSQQALSATLPALKAKIADTATAMAETLAAGGKLLICGNGGSAADSLHLSSELLNKFVLERAPLAAIALNSDVSALTSIANDFAFEYVFSKQIEALGKENDMLLVFTTSGNSANISRAIQAANQLDMRVIALTGKTGGGAARLLQENAIELRVPNDETARIQEVHGLIIHCLCDLIDQQLFGETR
ncbi:MAG: SIS domain-containing protein [Proteobacteria bacterium]|nr:SIS domain-containing protein [Pseudomonadota bacterium]